MVTAGDPETGRSPRVRRGPSSASRRAGYAIAALVNAALLFVVAVWPGWRALRILTAEAALVIPWVVAALVAGIVVNLLDLLFDRRWLSALGDLVTTAIGLVAAVVLWDVFPFDVGALGAGWVVVARVVLLVAIVGSGIGIVVALVRIVRAAIAPSGPAGDDVRDRTRAGARRPR